jgi:hypothetical protein
MLPHNARSISARCRTMPGLEPDGPSPLRSRLRGQPVDPGGARRVSTLWCAGRKATSCWAIGEPSARPGDCARQMLAELLGAARYAHQGTAQGPCSRHSGDTTRSCPATLADAYTARQGPRTAVDPIRTTEEAWSVVLVYVRH